jgi:hypothetical protein
MAIEGDSWRRQVRRWLESRRTVPPSVAADVIRFFELGFEHVQCRDRAWFGTHPTRVSLVVGHIWLVALKGRDKRFWVLVGQDFPPMEGIEYHPVKPTLRSRSPLRWAHFSSEALPKVIAGFGPSFPWPPQTHRGRYRLASPCSVKREDVPRLTLPKSALSRSSALAPFQS